MCIETNTEDLYGIGMDVYVLNDIDMDRLKHTHFPLYNKLMLMRTEQLIREAVSPISK